MIRTCDRGHASLDAANWTCPWCEIERLRAEVARATAVEDMWRAEALKAQQALVEARQK